MAAFSPGFRDTVAASNRLAAVVDLLISSTARQIGAGHLLELANTEDAAIGEALQRQARG